MNFISLCLALTTTLFICSIPSSSSIPPLSAPKSSWEKTDQSNGITSFRREIPGSPIIALRGEGIIDAPISLVASVILDYQRAHEWVDSLEENRLIKRIGLMEYIGYSRIGTPILLKNRDFLVRGKIEINQKDKALILSMRPTIDPSVPEENHVRGELTGRWELKSIENNRKTFVVAEMHGDPKGSIPKWLVNLFQKGWPKNTLESLQKQVKRPNVKLIPEIQEIFEHNLIPAIPNKKALN